MTTPPQDKHRQTHPQQPGGSSVQASWRVWLDVAALTIAIFAAAGSCRAYNFSRDVEHRLQESSKAELYLSLRNRFISEILQDLPNPDFPLKRYTPAHCNALKRYWHHAFDEWFLTTQLNPQYAGQLWNDFFRIVIGRALERPALAQLGALMVRDPTEFGELSAKFGHELELMPAGLPASPTPACGYPHAPRDQPTMSPASAD